MDKNIWVVDDDESIRWVLEKGLGESGMDVQTFKFKGKKNSERDQILKDAKLLESAGIFSIVLECVESSLAKKVTNEIKIPTIGIGASKNCDGQILVFDDLIGLNDTKIKFVKKFANTKKYLSFGIKKFASEVKSKKYPQKKHSY